MGYGDFLAQDREYHGRKPLDGSQDRAMTAAADPKPVAEKLPLRFVRKWHCDDCQCQNNTNWHDEIVDADGTTIAVVDQTLSDKARSAIATLTTRLAEVERERDALRIRTHEIQAEESKKRAAADSVVARLGGLMKRASELCKESIDPTTGHVTHGGGLLGGVSEYVRGIIAGLIDRAEAVERERDAAREALAKYGRHTMGCQLHMSQGSPCKCGFEQARAALSPATKEME